MTITDWYGKGQRAVEVASDTAVWHHGGMPAVELSDLSDFPRDALIVYLDNLPLCCTESE